MIEFTEVFIAGRRLPPSQPNIVTLYSPYDGSVVGRAPLASKADIDTAVEAARKAFDFGPWPRLRPEERRAVQERFFALYEARSDELARLAGRLHPRLETGRRNRVGRPVLGPVVSKRQ